MSAPGRLTRDYAQGENMKFKLFLQFNFKFNLSEDMYAEDSVELLQNSGIQFDRHEREVFPLFYEFDNPSLSDVHLFKQKSILRYIGDTLRLRNAKVFGHCHPLLY